MNWLVKILGNMFSRQPLDDEFLRRREVIVSVNLPKARQIVLAFLSDKSKFVVTPGKLGHFRIPKQAGPITTEFFNAFHEVAAVFGDMHLGGEDIGQSKLYPQLFRIGTDVEHSEVLIQVPDDSVFVADGTEPSYQDDWFPSIYHYILDNIVAIYDLDIKTISDK